MARSALYLGHLVSQRAEQVSILLSRKAVASNESLMSCMKTGQGMKVLKQLLFELNWAGFVVRRRLKSRVFGLKRMFVLPQLPQNPDGKVLIHLGCGDINSPEFINVAVRSAPHVDYIRVVTDLSIFPDNYADLGYACHLLEHIRRNNIRRML